MTMTDAQIFELRSSYIGVIKDMDAIGVGFPGRLDPHREYELAIANRKIGIDSRFTEERATKALADGWQIIWVDVAKFDWRQISTELRRTIAPKRKKHLFKV